MRFTLSNLFFITFHSFATLSLFLASTSHPPTGCRWCSCPPSDPFSPLSPERAPSEAICVVVSSKWAFTFSPCTCDRLYVPSLEEGERKIRRGAFYFMFTRLIYWLFRWNQFICALTITQKKRESVFLSLVTLKLMKKRRREVSTQVKCVSILDVHPPPVRVYILYERRFNLSHLYYQWAGETRVHVL